MVLLLQCWCICTMLSLLSPSFPLSLISTASCRSFLTIRVWLDCWLRSISHYNLINSAVFVFYWHLSIEPLLLTDSQCYTRRVLSRFAVFCLADMHILPRRCKKSTKHARLIHWPIHATSQLKLTKRENHAKSRLYACINELLAHKPSQIILSSLSNIVVSSE